VTARLASLTSEVDVLEVAGSAGDTAVTAVTQDSESVISGALYCCIRGSRVDGHDLAPGVVASGAGSLLVERLLAVDVPQVRVADTRQAVAPVAAAFFDHPSRQLSVVGVTGTNGKTTTAALVSSMTEAAGRPSAVIGTLSGSRTTPEAPVLQAKLAEYRDGGKQVVAMEVSSMALDQHRADAISFAVAVFTNLTQDHLDYHGSMEAYFEAKARLFQPGRARVALVNVDDRWGRRLASTVTVPLRTFAMTDAEDLEAGLTSSRFRWRGQLVILPMGGRHNVANALAAAHVGELLGLSPAQVAEGLTTARPVSGRLEPVDSGQPFTVLVDYAHTPDGLEQVLRAVADAVGPSGQVTVVFGCGGERDRAKRPLMAAVATNLAALVVLTSDNPRHDDPQTIIAETAAGAEGPGLLVIEPDRATAIALAIEGAKPGDVVVIAGKGHETEQVVGDKVIPFDDREVARAELAKLGWGSGGTQ
jgi:UDP-N-acetylmuramoyl-L-alanyl-D-glutamate--2,6-diaminopimelate ligase